MEYETRSDKLKKSVTDALNPLNVIARLFFLWFFSLVAGLPYAMFHLNKIGARISEAGELTGFETFKIWISELTALSYKGLQLGLGTIGQTIINFKEFLDANQWGNIIVAIVILIFASLSVAQAVMFVLNVFDGQVGRKYNYFISFLFALVIVGFLISPITYAITGETLTSHISIEDEVGDLTDTLLNETINNTQIQEASNTMNLIMGELT